MQLLKSIEERNSESFDKIQEFRMSKILQSPDVYDMDFYHARTANPFYGFVEVQNDGSKPFFMFNNNDDIIAEFYLWYGKNGYERTTIREWVHRVKSSSVIFDIGANTGIFTLLGCFAAEQGQKVVAFEPTSRACSRVYENCNVNGVLDRVKIEKTALSNKSGTVEFMHYENASRISSGASYVEGASHFAVHSRELCETVTLDSYIESTGMVPDLLKIDVEGAEIHVAEGAKQLINSRKSTFIIEVIPQTIDGVLQNFPGYDVHILDDHLNRAIPLQGSITRHTNLLLEPAK